VSFLVKNELLVNFSQRKNKLFKYIWEIYGKGKRNLGNIVRKKNNRQKHKNRKNISVISSQLGISSQHLVTKIYYSSKIVKLENLVNGKLPKYMRKSAILKMSVKPNLVKNDLLVTIKSAKSFCSGHVWKI